MQIAIGFIERTPWILIIVACLTLGLAPFNPPHIVEKLKMLSIGNLKKAVDWFDLAWHILPFMVLFLKSILTISK